MESSADGEEEDESREEQNKLESDKMEEGCGKFFTTTILLLYRISSQLQVKVKSQRSVSR